MIYLDFSRFLSGLDLNFEFMMYGVLCLHAKGHPEPGQTCLFSTHGVSALEHFSSMRGHAKWRSQGPRFRLQGSARGHGLCSTDLPRVFAGHQRSNSRLPPKPLALATNSRFQTMKTELCILLLVLGLAGCQQKSEIDKCVEAQVLQFCVDTRVDSKPFYAAMGITKEECLQQATETQGGALRDRCLKAQAGK